MFVSMDGPYVDLTSVTLDVCMGWLHRKSINDHLMFIKTTTHI